MLKSFKQLIIIITAVILAAVGFCVYQIQKLNSNLSTTTKITQSLRTQLDQTLKERETYKEKLDQSEQEITRLSTEVDTAKKSVQSLEELNKTLSSSESSLQKQTQKVEDLEKKLATAESFIQKRKDKSSELEKRYQAVKTDATQSAQYAKLLESEWLSSLAKEKDLQKDLDKTVAEFSSNNQDKGRLERDVATMHYNMAVILTDQKNFEAAIREYKKVLELRPNDADAHYNIGVIYDTEMKDNIHAIEHYKAYLKISPNSKEALRVSEWVQEKEFNEKLKFKM